MRAQYNQHKTIGRIFLELKVDVESFKSYNIEAADASSQSSKEAFMMVKI